MLSKLIKRFSRKRRRRGVRVIPRDQHQVSRRNISSGALKTMKRLHESGYAAFIVGGSVRDLQLGGHPKDFDIATDATPENVKGLFRGSRIVGRRFRIVHVRMGREIIEVTTFRAGHEEGDKGSLRNEEGMLLRDNVYGTVEDDAWRRDFSINALYYTSKGFEIHDFVGGMEDLDHRIIRVIGDPVTRYQEDPVRMLRAVRFAAKLQFEIESASASPLPKLGKLLAQVAAARLFDEVLKLFLSGYAAPTLALLQQYRLFEHLFPATAKALAKDDEGQYQRLLHNACANTDQRIREDKPVTPAFIFAALLWPAVEEERKRRQRRDVRADEALQQAANLVVSRQVEITTIPKRFGYPMKEIWEMQPRLGQRHGSRAERLVSQGRFRAAYDFLLLREQAGEETGGLGQWWTRYQSADEEGRAALLRQLGDGPRRKRRRRPRSRKPADSGQ